MGTWTVHTSNRLDVLLAHLAERLAADPLPPLEDEIVLVPGQAMARWVTLELARAHGIAGSLRLPFPLAYLHGLCATETVPAARANGDRVLSPFEREALALRVFRLLGDETLQPTLGAAAAYCRDDPDQQKRWQLATAVAQCFDDYQLHRPELLRALETGDVRSLPPDAAWQSRLYAALLAEVEPTQRAEAVRLFAVDRLLADPERSAERLPHRLSVFGVASLPQPLQSRLHALSQFVDVALYAVRPTEAFFGDQARRKGDARTEDQSGPSLLQAFGKQSREFFDLLLDLDDGTGDQPLAFVDPGTDCLLHALQSDVMHLVDRRRGGDEEPLRLAPDDASLRVHSTHGMLREMEVLRDQILDAFATIEGLAPQDVLVLLPDVEAYAPYVEAAFAPLQNLLRVRVADRDPAAERAAPRVLLALFSLPTQRFSVSSMLALLDDDVVARRFGIARSQLALLADFLDRTHVRWGLDGDQKARDHDLPDERAHTWHLAKERLLLGLATGPMDLPVLGLLPTADPTSGRVPMLAGFCAFLEAVDHAASLLAGERSLREWAEVLDELCDRFFEPETDLELAAVAPLRDAARRLRELHGITTGREEVRMQPLALRAWLEERLATKADARGFLGGQITVAALRPMRTVPMRVIAIGGLHDGSFPRGDARREFDLLKDDRRPGARSRRDEDRQTFLDALLAARDRVVLTYVGRSQKDNSECAPSTVLAELLDAIDAGFEAPSGTGAARDHVLVEHPLQSFSARYGEGDPRRFAYATTRTRETERTNARAASPKAATAKPTSTGSATAKERDAAPRLRLDLDELVRFWRNPQRDYCRRVLDAQFPDDDDAIAESEPFALGGLARHAAIADFVTHRLDGASDDEAEAALLASGLLPPGPLGRVALDAIREVARPFAKSVHEQLHPRPPRARLCVRGADFELTGDLPAIRTDAMVLWRAGDWDGPQAMQAYVLHVAMSAAAASGARLPVETRLLSPKTTHRLPVLQDPHRLLQSLVDGCRRGRTTPLPSPLRASLAFARALVGEGETDEALRTAYAKARTAYREAEGSFDHDLPDPAIALCFAEVDPIGLPEFAAWARAVHCEAVRVVDPERPRKKGSR